MTNGWNESAAAWIAEIGEGGDWGRSRVLDAPMLERVRVGAFRDALDVGCGEGRFCRMLRAEGLSCIGVDPARALVDYARERDPAGDYRLGQAEALDFGDASFDLVVSYLSLIDIEGLDQAISEMARVLRPGGALLIANLASFFTAGPPSGWIKGADGEPRFFIDHYLEERGEWVSWAGLYVQNWHRPLSRYMSHLLAQGLQLSYFAEPEPIESDAEKAARYRRVPFFLVMEWRKPKA
jgi:ubiquinone/menaquinone biosynthesis C-methylase UbiE